MTIHEVSVFIFGLSIQRKIVLLAVAVLVVELAFRHFAPASSSYARWTAFFRAVGIVWTAVLLSVVYVIAVGMVSLGMRIAGKDLLDRRLLPELSFWRKHEPNPLGASASVRHQF